jgi:hypothetical protein
MRRVSTLVLLVGLVASACATSADPAAEETATAPPTTTEPAALAATPASETLPPPPTIHEPIVPNPLTQGRIDAEMLALMPMPRLDAPLAGFVASVITPEPNEVAVDRLPPSYDEAADHAAFGRENGYRSILRPTRFNGTGTLAVDTWVATFTTATGASDYLEDYAKDLAKKGDAGRAPGLVPTEVRAFPVEEVGEEAAGFVIVAEEPSTGATYQETILAFRIGRLLAFTSLFRDDDADVRIALLEVAGAFEARIVSVLDGTLEIVEVPPEPELMAYAFSYRQSLTQRYRYVVVPDGVDDSISDVEGDDVVDGEGGDGGGDAGDEGGDVTDTTAPVQWQSETSATSVQADGVVVGEDVECSIRISSPAMSIRRTYVLAAGKAWVADGGRSFEEIDQYAEPWAADLVYCPGWSPDRDASGVRAVTRPGTGELVPYGEGMAERFVLNRDDLVTIGLGGEDGSGITVSRFEILTAGEGSWVVDLTLRMSGAAVAIERAVGPGFYPGASLSIDVAFAADRLNDPELSITIP